jgi:hypothetical protein
MEMVDPLTSMCAILADAGVLQILNTMSAG